MIESEMNGIKVTVNNHGIRQSTIQPNYKTYDDHDSLKFASISTLISHKGTHLAIQAFETLKTEHAELDIFGGVGEKKVTRIGSNPWLGKVRFLLKGHLWQKTLPKF